MAFFKAKQVNPKCPHCPKVQWEVIERQDGRGVALSVLGDDGRPNGSIVPVVPVVCGNCGYMWSIARQVVQEWMAEEAQDANG